MNEKKISIVLATILIFFCGICYATNSIDNIKLLDNNDYRRIVFSLVETPEYYVENKNDSIDLKFINTTIKDEIINNFKKINDIDCLELTKNEKYIKFKIIGKFKRYIYIKPSDYNKYHRVIVDIYNQEKMDKENIEEFLNSRILVKENNSLSLNDIIEKSLNREEKQLDNSDNVLNEIIELKILEKEIKQEQSNLDNFLVDNLLNKQQSQKEIKKIKKKNYYTIVIDAGHGGKDPGTISKKKTKEKNINLDYALAIKKELSKNKNIHVYLTRNNDVFLSLTDRLSVARKYEPDLFISIHSNSSSNTNTRGLSIYTLSKEASDTRTASLANSENKTNIISGMNLFNEYQDTINTLVDLSRKEILNESRKIADMFVYDFRINRINMLDNPHKQANFAVLLAPDFSSVLIELGFLSNKKDEKMLNSNLYKKTFSKSVSDTINRIIKMYNW